MKTTTAFDDTTIIFKYTRQDAIDDGVLVDLTANFPNETRQYKYQVCCTERVWFMIEDAAIQDAERLGGELDLGAYVWDICNMSIMCGKLDATGTMKVFDVYMPLDHSERPPKRLKAVCHGDDEGEPCITIMQIDED